MIFLHINIYKNIYIYIYIPLSLSSCCASVWLQDWALYFKVFRKFCCSFLVSKARLWAGSALALAAFSFSALA